MDEFEKDMELEAEQHNISDVPQRQPMERKPKKKKRKLKKVAKYILAFVLICIAVVVYKTVGCNNRSVENMYDFESDSNCQIVEYNGKVLALNYDGAKIINLDGTQSENIEYHMSNPHMNVCGEMILLYDKDNRKLAVFKGGEKKYSFESEFKIKSAKVNKDGHVVFVSDESGYNYRVNILNNKGEEEYIWKIGDEYLLDADISPDGKKLVAATITTATGQIVQNIVMVDVEKAVEIGRTTTEGVMPLRVEFTENGMAIVVSDDRIGGYNTKAEKKWEESFENRLIDYFAVDDEGNTVVSLRSIKNNSTVLAYTKNGKNSGEYTTSTKATYVDLNSKHIAVCEENKISLINYSGKVVAQMNIKKEVMGISVVSNNKVIVLCKDCIQLFKL